MGGSLMNWIHRYPVVRSSQAVAAVPNGSSPKLRGPRSRHCTPAAPTLPTDINGLPPPAVLVVANCAFCQTDQPSTVPCPVKINDLQHERIGKIERDITAFEVAPQLSEHTAEDAVLALENLLKQAVSIRDLALQQEAALAELEDKIAACERSGRDAQDVIARFQTLALVDSLDALRTAIAQSERLRALQSESDKVSASLIEEGGRPDA
jgi:hypothetical protein